MSTVQLTLRQPPNVDFVHGFPGIPAGVNRQHASVKGLVELRVGAGHPVKAKYVKVELRKIEVIPGGGPANTYSDVVGAGSVNIWSAKEEWDTLNSQDIPFNIRIPENIPPSVALGNGGGIRYELAAEICIKTKKGLFRRNAAPVRETTAPIVIDKHELHSTWPVYLKPDVRETEKDGFHLTVERTHTCYGPGDRVAARATLKSTAGTGTVLSYEIALRETAVFRHGPGSSARSNIGPTVRSDFIGSERVPAGVAIQQGLSDTVELNCTIPASHTTTTVVTAQHIEIVYSLAVRAILEGGVELVIDNIPAMMSNWPRNMSDGTVRKIGYAPHLSDPVPPGPNSPVRPASVVSVTPPPGRQPRQQRPYSIGERVGSGGGGAAAGRPDMAATLPAGSISGLGGADELGVVRPNGHVSERPGLRPGTFSGNSNIPLIPEDPEPSSSVAGSQRPAGNDSESSNKAGRGQNRYTITNADDYDAQPFMDALEEKNRLKQQMADEEIQTASGSVVAKPASIPAAPHDAGGRQLRQGWLNAEEEKKKQQDQARRYQQAKKVAEDIQNAAIASMQAPMGHDPNMSAAVSPASVTLSVNAQPATTPAAPGPITSTATPWPSAEQEKHEQLFKEAQERARRAQAAALSSNTGSQPVNVVQYPQYTPTKPRTSPTPTAAAPQAASSPMNVIRQDRTTPQQGTGYNKPSAGAMLYQNAMMAVNSSVATPATTPPRPVKNTLAPSPPPAGPAYTSSPYTPTATLAHTSARGSSGSPPTVPRSQYANAEEEKAQLRYLSAKRAVEARQQHASSASVGSPPGSNSPVPYEQLFPGANGNAPTQTPAASSSSQQPQYTPQSPGPPSPSASASRVGAVSPTSFTHSRTTSDSRMASEDGYRRQMNPLEAIASLRGNLEGGQRPVPPPRRQTPGVISPVSPSTQSGFRTSGEGARGPSPPGYAGLPPGAAPPVVRSAYQPPAPVLTAEQEKAQLRARYGEGDNANVGGSSSSNRNRAPSSAPASHPPPMDMAPGYEEPLDRPLNAAEEKARLAAQFAAEERAAKQMPGYGPAPTLLPPPAQHQPDQSPWQQQQTQPPPHPPPQQLYSQPSHSPYIQPSGSAFIPPPPSGGAGSGIAAPVATRPLVPASIPSQGSGVSASSEYRGVPEGTLQPPHEYGYSEPQSYSDYYAADPAPVSTENASFGNGSVYATGNDKGNGSGATFMNTDPYAKNGDEGTQLLIRDPSISQGKRRAVEASPPPLAPRPPVHYIHETIDANTPPHERNWGNQDGAAQHDSSGAENGVNFGLEVRPFSPLDLSFDQHNVPFERPPLPPKVPI